MSHDVVIFLMGAVAFLSAMTLIVMALRELEK